MFFRKKKKDKDFVENNGPATELSSVARDRLAVSKFRPTELDEDEESYWERLTELRKEEAADRKRYIIACIVLAVIMVVVLVLGLIWYEHTGGGVYSWR